MPGWCLISSFARSAWPGRFCFSPRSNAICTSWPRSARPRSVDSKLRAVPACDMKKRTFTLDQSESLNLGQIPQLSRCHVEVALNHCYQRGGRDVVEDPDVTRLLGGEAAAMKATGVGEDHRPSRCGERLHGRAGDALLELLR